MFYCFGESQGRSSSGTFELNGWLATNLVGRNVNNEAASWLHD